CAGPRAPDARRPRQHYDDTALHERARAFTRRINAPGTSPTQRTRGYSRRTERTGGMMKTAGIGFEAVPPVTIRSLWLYRGGQNPQNMARPARFELAAPRLGGGCSIP